MPAYRGLLIGLGMALAAVPAFAQPAASQTPTATAATPKAPAKPGPQRVKVAQAAPAAAPQPAARLTANLAAQPGAPHTLAEALAITYSSQPALLAERANLRSVDEKVPQALAGWRPTVIVAGNTGYGDGLGRTYSNLSGSWIKTRTDRLIGVAQATLSQPLYTGGKVQANVNAAKNQVMAERANLLDQEQNSFLAVVTAYVGAGTANSPPSLGVIQAQQTLALNINNEQVLAKQLQATNDRFRVGEITRTDVAQAEAALAGATAARQTSEGNLQTARATFQQVVGYLPPANLVEPQPLSLPVKTEEEATALAARNNPKVIASLFNDAAAKDQVDVAFAQLMPQVSLQGQIFQQNNSGARSVASNGYQAVVNLSVPIYQGGAEYSAVRQARQTEQQKKNQLDDARRSAVQNATQAWEQFAAAKAAAQSTRAAIQANTVALEGVEREAIVGSRTTLDVLNAQQALLNSQTQLVQNLAQLVATSYQVAAAVGRLTARDLHLPVPLYDDTAYYQAVKDKWVGLGDYATDQPGR